MAAFVQGQGHDGSPAPLDRRANLGDLGRVRADQDHRADIGMGAKTDQRPAVGGGILAEQAGAVRRRDDRGTRQASPDAARGRAGEPGDREDQQMVANAGGAVGAGIAQERVRHAEGLKRRRG